MGSKFFGASEKRWQGKEVVLCITTNKKNLSNQFFMKHSYTSKKYPQRRETLFLTI